MDQIALNTVAIGIFCMTASVLLGPFIHLSPGIPAGVTLAVLGIVTVDTLSFRGQGALLFLDWWAQRSLQYRQRIVHHEAGHFLVAYLLNIPIEAYTLNAWDAWRQGHPGQGGVVVAPPDGLQAPLSQDQIQAYCTVWAAGGVAEFLVYGQADGNVEDQQQLRTLLAKTGAMSRLEVQTQERLATQKARSLLQNHWSAYEGLVEAMAQGDSVPECYSRLRQPQPPREAAIASHPLSPSAEG